MHEYNHKKIEKKWQEKWEKEKLYEARDDSSKRKYYALVEFPYPSGDGLHVGHPRPYIGMDVIARKRRAEGYNVLYPIGWDAFGLPTENYAIKTGIHPKEVTKRNTDIFRRQIKSLGLSFDWSREINTSEPQYYKWTQWIFLQFFKRGLAYKANIAINWCLSCKIGLANEEIADGRCQRCGGATEARNKEQWMLSITKYADRLDKDLDTVDYAEPIKIQQRNWIGKSRGAEITFQLRGSRMNADSPSKILHPQNLEGQARIDADIKIFTTRPDTLFGATYVALAPEHKLLMNNELGIKNYEEVEKYVNEAKGRTEIERTADGTEKTGVELKGIKAVNPANGKEIPIFIADYVVAQYGTGAVMGVPAHDRRDYEFAKINNLEIRKVIRAERTNCVIIHGCPSPDEASYNAEKRTYDKHWMPWLKKHLEKAGIPTYAPLMPEPWMPDYEKWKKEFEKLDVSRDTILVGHSCGASFLVRWLSETGRDIGRLILVAPSKDSCEDEDVREKFYACDVNEKIQKQVSDVVIFIADNGQKENKKTARLFHRKLGGELVELKGMGHFTLKDMGKEDFPELLEAAARAKEAYAGEGKIVNSGKFNGMESGKARMKISEFVGGAPKVTYKLRDWVFSRQRYWGEPIPLIFCEMCKKSMESTKSKAQNPNKIQNPNSKFQIQSEGERLNPGWFAVTEDELPVELPDIKNYKPTDAGESPLANADEWVNVKCPKCGGQAKRETDVMPNWAGSSWYFLAYALGYQKSKIKNQKSFWDKKKLKYWLPVDWYNGGMEHTTLHLLYSRFWHKFLYDIKVAPTPEPYQKRTSHGLILAEGGEKMSKSKGNVINPDGIVENIGADSLRLYEMFMGPFDQAISWSANGVIGARRFLEKVWRLQAKLADTKKLQTTSYKIDSLLHKTIKKVGDDIEAMKFNTAVSAMMILANEMEKNKTLPLESYLTLLVLLAPFAPHMSEELWEKLGNKKSIFLEGWPEYDRNKIIEKKITIVVQVNGKVRGTVEAEIGAAEEDLKRKALELENAQNWIKGEKIKKIIYVKDRLLNIVI